MIAHQDDLSRDAIVALGKQVGMDTDALASALDQHTYASAVAKEMDAASEIGVRATPQFLVNGEPVTGALPIESFRAAIDKALAAR
jgi:predicted DsbA family dithiol-disulfide isomerase